MKENELLERVKEVVQQFADPSRKVEHDTAFVKDLGLESIQSIEMLCEIEDAFDLVIGESELSDVVTVADLSAVVEKNLR